MMITDEDVRIIEKFIDIRNRGYYADGTQVTEVYNRVLNRSVRPTNCGSCISQRIRELEEALRRFKASNNGGGEASEPRTEGDLAGVKAEENKAPGGDTSMKERMARVRAAKKKK